VNIEKKIVIDQMMVESTFVPSGKLVLPELYRIALQSYRKKYLSQSEFSDVLGLPSTRYYRAIIDGRGDEQITNRLVAVVKRGLEGNLSESVVAVKESKEWNEWRSAVINKFSKHGRPVSECELVRGSEAMELENMRLISCHGLRGWSAVMGMTVTTYRTRLMTGNVSESMKKAAKAEAERIRSLPSNLPIQVDVTQEYIDDAYSRVYDFVKMKPEMKIEHVDDILLDSTDEEVDVE